MRLKFVVGSDSDESYRCEGYAEVSDSAGLLIQAPYDDVAECEYNRFCDNVVPRVIRNLPYDWYFINNPRECK